MRKNFIEQSIFCFLFLWVVAAVVPQDFTNSYISILLDTIEARKLPESYNKEADLYFIIQTKVINNGAVINNSIFVSQYKLISTSGPNILKIPVYSKFWDKNCYINMLLHAYDADDEQDIPNGISHFQDISKLKEQVGNDDFLASIEFNIATPQFVEEHIENCKKSIPEKEQIPNLVTIKSNCKIPQQLSNLSENFDVTLNFDITVVLSSIKAPMFESIALDQDWVILHENGKLYLLNKQDNKKYIFILDQANNELDNAVSK